MRRVKTHEQQPLELQQQVQTGIADWTGIIRTAAAVGVAAAVAGHCQKFQLLQWLLWKVLQELLHQLRQRHGHWALLHESGRAGSAGRTWRAGRAGGTRKSRRFRRFFAGRFDGFQFPRLGWNEETSWLFNAQPEESSGNASKISFNDDQVKKVVKKDPSKTIFMKQSMTLSLFSKMTWLKSIISIRISSYRVKRFRERLPVRHQRSKRSPKGQPWNDLRSCCTLHHLNQTFK